MSSGQKEKMVMYLHAGSGNHGCEAIVNSTCHMLPEIPKILMTNSKKEDEAYSLSGLAEIIEERKMSEHFFAHVFYYIWRKVMKDPESFMRYRFKEVLEKKKAPLYVSIGGDNYCYDIVRAEAMVANSTFHSAGAKTVLWGCSIEPELLKEQALVEDLKKYNLITVRESLTKEALDEAGIQENVQCFPDPAFSLGLEAVDLPVEFEAGNTIGINISPMIVQYEKVPGIAVANYKKLMDYILENTNQHIALIPHVVWDSNDDRKTLAELYRGYEDNPRVCLIPDRSCVQLKYIISKCRAFIGARTHSTIAAYSTCVPTLVVGYSVKARGIAKDLFGTEENYVRSVQKLSNPEELIEAYRWLMENEEDIRAKLQTKMPGYIEQARAAGEVLTKLWQES